MPPGERLVTRRASSYRRGIVGAALLAACLLLWVGQGKLAEAQTPAIPLSPGWNNVLYTGAPGPISTALAPLGANLNGVLIWDAAGQRWHSYYPGATPPGDLQTILPNQAYWIDVTAATLLPPGLVSPAPVQLLSGWNNVAYVGPGAPGSSLIEQNPVWTWDALNQRWLFRDPTRPGASDFQSLTQLQTYWIDLTGNTTTSQPGNSAATPPSPTTSTSAGCYSFSSTQPALSDVNDALTRAGLGALQLSAGPAPSAEHTGSDGSTLQQPPYIPPTILRSIAWVESSWHQAGYSTQAGQSGPTLASSGCAYGLMQIASGMSVSGTPTAQQQLIGTDFSANVAAAVQLLVNNWNRNPSALPYVGRRDPHVLEDWYFAIWAYNCFGDPCSAYGVHNDPDDPSLPWPRPAYNSPDQHSSTTSFTAADYPYEEMVYGFVDNPPAPGGQPLWPAIQALLPQHGAVGFPEPHTTAEASAHLDNGAALATVAPPASAAGTPAPSGAPQMITPAFAAAPGN
jgi:hypothetical protein